VPYFMEKADFVHDHRRWTGQDFGDKLPSQVFREQVQTCFIDDETGLHNRHYIGIETLTWEADCPHSDSTWPQSPETLMKSLDAVQMPDDEIHMVMWQNACRWYKFDPFAHRPRAECTVGALRTRATDVDTTPREYGDLDHTHNLGAGAKPSSPTRTWSPTARKPSPSSTNQRQVVPRGEGDDSGPQRAPLAGWLGPGRGGSQHGCRDSKAVAYGRSVQWGRD
jgi:hypothetical protein